MIHEIYGPTKHFTITSEGELLLQMLELIEDISRDG